jgi:PIN domain nuclease of toxin-antitoxin system
MTYLLDTHYLLWCIADSKKLSKRVSDTISDPENRIIVSTISFWEISLKASIGKLDIPGIPLEKLPSLCANIGFEIECLSAIDSSTYHQLAYHFHKDPFDRMLIWQAIKNDFTLVSDDSNVGNYTVAGLKILSSK